MGKYDPAIQDVFQALADPTRCAIVAALGQGPRTVSTLAEPFEMALPSLMKHLAVLERNGVVRSHKQGRVRTCELVPERLAQAEQWLAGQRAAWSISSKPFTDRSRPMAVEASNNPDTDLVISRVLNAPRAAMWRAWTDPELLRQWWCPKPWTTEVRAFDLRPGGAFHTFMQGPDGGSSDNPGSFLEIVPQQRLVFTSMLGPGWRPQSPWLGFTAIITMEDEGQGCRYTAQVMHPDKALRDQHEQLGFFDGWNTVIGQLEAFAAGL